MDEISIQFVPETSQGSEFARVDLINKQDERVGRAHCLIERDKFTIYLISIHPEYERRGYAGSFVNYAKKKYSTVIAAQVEADEISFWEKMAFVPDEESNYIFVNRKK